MLVHPQFDPIAFSIGPLAFRWYGLMYLVAFALFYALGRLRARQAWRGMAPDGVDDLLFWGVLGVVLGGRLGYVLFYKPGYYLDHPLEALMLWKGGMSFHGGLLGVVLVICLWAIRRRRPILAVGDFVAPLVPLGLGAVRLGNFINGELWGRVADPATWPWAMVFPHAGDGLPRHPSQLYQALCEGPLLFALLWWFSRRSRPAGAVTGLFFAGYGVLRCITELAREPDNFLGLLTFGLSMGQWLSLPMILAGIVLLVLAYRPAATAPAATGRAAPATTSGDRR